MEVRIMRKSSVFCGGLLLSVIFACNVRADEISDLKKQLTEMQARLEQLEKQQKQVIVEEVNKAVEKKQITAATPEKLKWLENVKLYGDLRYRYEGIDSESGGIDKPGRHRNRIRARLGLDAKVTDEIDLGFRLATSEPKEDAKGVENGDPVSTNQSLDNGFSKKPIWIDLAFVKWHPKDTGFNVIGGKMETPFYRVGSNQLIFDSDLTPEGGAVQYKIPLAGGNELFANAGGFWVNENVLNGSTETTVDQSMFGFQGGLKHTFENKTYLMGGASYYNYGNLKDQPTIFDAKKGFGNTVFTNAAGNTFYVNDFDIVEGFAEYGFNIAETPAAVYGDYVKNIAADTSQDTGWLIGAKYGKCKDPGSWELGYDYRDIEADAVAGIFSDSDFIGGGTDGKGHRFGGVYQLTKNVQAGLTYFLNKKGDNDDDYRRLQADLMFKF
jgi:hypothetical protein